MDVIYVTTVIVHLTTKMQEQRGKADNNSNEIQKDTEAG